MLIYLGIFDRVFNWVLDRILSPVFNFVSSLLNKVFTYLFNKVLAPVLLPVLEKVFRWALDLVLQLLGSLFYFILQTLLKLIDYMEIAFDIFIGLREVSMVKTLSNGKTEVVTGSLLEVLYQMDAVRTAFLAITLAGIGLALLLTIFSVVRSSMDLEFDKSRSVVKVMKDFFRCCIRFMLVPFMMVFLMNLSVIVLSGLNTALTGGDDGDATLGSTIFVISSLDAANEERYNISYTGSDQADNIGPEDDLRRSYYRNDAKKNYKNSAAVGGDGSKKGDFQFGEFDYLTGYLSSVFLLVILAMCLMVFVQRIFEILILYIVSPYFVAMMPLDGGEKFDQWKDMFIAKFFTGFGSAIGMRLYLMLCPVVMGNKLRFTDGNSLESDYIVKLIFLLGGAWAVYKSGSMITMLLNEQAAGSEQMAGAMAGGMMLNQIRSAPSHAVGAVKSVKHGAKKTYRAVRRMPLAAKGITRKAAYKAGKIHYKAVKTSRMAVQAAARTVHAVEEAPSAIRNLPRNTRRAPSVAAAKFSTAGGKIERKFNEKMERAGKFLDDNYRKGAVGLDREYQKLHQHSAAFKQSTENIGITVATPYYMARDHVKAYKERRQERKETMKIQTRPRSAGSYAPPKPVNVTFQTRPRSAGGHNPPKPSSGAAGSPAKKETAKTQIPPKPQLHNQNTQNRQKKGGD